MDRPGVSPKDVASSTSCARRRGLVQEHLEDGLVEELAPGRLLEAALEAQVDVLAPEAAGLGEPALGHG